ncbi:DUF4405 domain-containing protein [Campylobacter lanienae]|uniref:DUF4405 domain-containing protein n=1 Tax=Campylobacter lanienae TaxID=75658 RepID=UPI0024322ECA|nr:DUF4405 domain-containing protein [Campylobacter lanienae]MDD5786460.1 DUF4405 domain-containing protein [Campylobacter lanienae]
MKVSKPIATTATIATFFIVGATGVFMFFDLKNYGIKTIHEYVGIAMVLACVLHIFANLAPFKKYFSGKKLGFISSAIVLCVIFMLFAPNSKSAQKELYSIFMAVNLNNAIIAFNSNKTAIENYLNSKNIKFEDINLKEFIAKNNLNEAEFIKILIKR